MSVASKHSLLRDRSSCIRRLAVLGTGVCGLTSGAVYPAIRSDLQYVLIHANSAGADFAGMFLSFLFLSVGVLGILAFHVAAPVTVFYAAIAFSTLFAAAAGLGPWFEAGNPIHAAEWMGFSLACVLTLSVTPLLAVARARHLRRHTGLRCLGCGYTLLGNTSGRCPECGRPVLYEEFGLSEQDLLTNRSDDIERVMAIRHPRSSQAGLVFQLVFVVLCWFGTGFGLMQITPPGPKLHALWWSLAIGVAACSLFTAVRAYAPKTRALRFRFAHRISAGITLTLAAMVSWHQIKTLGTDMWSVPHRRISILREQIGFVYGFDNGRRTAGAPKPGDLLPAEPRALAAPVKLRIGHDDPDYATRTGPIYQRYLDQDDLERMAYRPTSTWTDHADIVLLYTPRPVMIRRWFHPVPDGWVALHGDGRVPLYKSANSLRRVLKRDNSVRVEMGLPSLPFEVFDR